MDFMQKQQLDQQQAQQQMQETQQLNQQVPQQIRQEVPQQIRQEVPQQIRQEAPQQMQQQAQQLNQQVRVNLPPAHAHAAAIGTPSQQMASAKKTYKARRAEKRLERKAGKNTYGKGNIVTDDIKRQLADYYTQRTNSLKNYFPDFESGQSKERELSKNLSGVDGRVLRIFCHGYRTDEAGQPATAADEKYKLEDEAFFDAFCSTDYTRRVPYLQRMVDELLSYKLKEDMFSDKTLRSNAAGFKSMADRLVYMKNVMADKHNAFYFESPLSPVKKEDLEGAFEFARHMAYGFGKECQKRGIDPNSMLSPYLEEPAAYSELADAYAAENKEKLTEYQKRKDSFRQTSAEPPTSEIYHPKPEVYQQVRSYLEGDVQKLLDCNVEELRALSDKELRRRRAELDELYSASLKVGKCLSLRHPNQSDLTLKDDLIGQRKLEYEYKSTVLQGLAERAAGLKKQGNKRVEDAVVLYQSQMTPKTEEFKAFFRDICRHDLPTLVVVPPKFDAVTSEFNAVLELPKEERKGEIAEAMERLKINHYFPLSNLAYSEEEIKAFQEQGKKMNIEEPLFRSFNSFLRLEAAQTLLTPETFRQMLLNLGAGARLTHDSPEEQREEAIKKNNAGLDTLREVMTAHYDMLERKYGNSIEHLSVKDIMEHYVDIGRDFSNSQVDCHVATLFPGFIREGNEKDERLRHQIEYYNQCGITIAAIIGFIGVLDPDTWASDAVIQKYISDRVTDVKHGVANARDELEKTQKNNSFQHPLDWTQKVKNPADAE